MPNIILKTEISPPANSSGRLERVGAGHVPG